MATQVPALPSVSKIPDFKTTGNEALDKVNEDDHKSMVHVISMMWAKPSICRNLSTFASSLFEGNTATKDDKNTDNGKPDFDTVLKEFQDVDPVRVGDRLTTKTSLSVAEWGEVLYF